jgi:hypothetical protein
MGVIVYEVDELNIFGEVGRCFSYIINMFARSLVLR